MGGGGAQTRILILWHFNFSRLSHGHDHCEEGLPETATFLSSEDTTLHDERFHYRYRTSFTSKKTPSGKGWKHWTQLKDEDGGSRVNKIKMIEFSPQYLGE